MDRQRAILSARKKHAELELLEFVRQGWSVIEHDTRFVEGWHIEAICRHLEAVAAGKITQLLINVPPGTSKSTLVCVFFPCWVWTRRPTSRWMFASYSDRLSIRDSIRCRNLICSEWYQRNWGGKWELTQDQNQKTKFENTMGGWRLATSVGGEATGEHPSFVVFDDPHKVAEAESEVERQGVIDWWDGTMASRGLMKGARRVGIMQRLHAKDLSAHLIHKGGWEHIVLPMRFEKDRMKPTALGWTDPRKTEGELLWPQVYSEERVAQIELDLGAYHSAGQLAQRPAPRGGGMFHRDWFEIVPVAPELIEVVRYWDKAGSKSKDSANTAGVLMGKTKLGWNIVLDVVKGQWSAAEREPIIKQTAESDRAVYGWSVATWTEQEPGSGGKESAENTIANLEGFRVFAEKVTGSKEVRADPLAAHSRIGRVKLLAAKWNADFLEEVELFPMGRRKDQVDGAAGAFNKLSAVGVRNPTAASYDRKEVFGDRLTALDF